MISNSKAVERFRQFVRERRALLGRKERSDPEIYEVASLRQVLEQVGAEMAAGFIHDPDELRALVAYANEKAATQKATMARPKPRARFRGLGR
jgi:hypothetical protein